MCRIIIRRQCENSCQECGKRKHGVSFEIRNPYGDRASEVFLCWEHFRLNVTAMIDAGVVDRQMQKTIVMSRCDCHCHCCFQRRQNYCGSDFSESGRISHGRAESQGFSETPTHRESP